MEGTAQNLIEMETEQRGHTSVAANHNTRHLLFFHNTEAVHSSILQIWFRKKADKCMRS